MDNENFLNYKENENFDSNICLKNRIKIEKEIDELRNLIINLKETITGLKNIDKFIYKFDIIDEKINQINDALVDYSKELKKFDVKFIDKVDRIEEKINKNENEFIKLESEKRMAKWLLSGAAIVIFTFLNWLSITTITQVEKIATNEQKILEIDKKLIK